MHINLHSTKEAVELLGTSGFGPRPVKRVIQQLVENEIAMGVLRGDFKEEDSVIVDVDDLPLAKDRPAQNRLCIKKLVSTSPLVSMVAND